MINLATCSGPSLLHHVDLRSLHIQHHCTLTPRKLFPSRRLFFRSHDHENKSHGHSVAWSGPDRMDNVESAQSGWQGWLDKRILLEAAELRPTCVKHSLLLNQAALCQAPAKP
jgi:hypothetical protein